MARKRKVPDSKPDYAEIARRAYKLWEREGQPHGRDLDHWLAAEREVLAIAVPQKESKTKSDSKRNTTRRALP